MTAHSSGLAGREGRAGGRVPLPALAWGGGGTGPDEARDRPVLPAWVSAPQSLASPRLPPRPVTRGLSPTNSEGDEEEELPQESAGEKKSIIISVLVLDQLI